jgi:hypothetical protein
MSLTCSRRDCLRVGAFGFLGLATKDLLAWADPAASAKSCVLIYLNGGPSHIDMFDLKPDAPAEIRGEFKPIATAVDGLRICEHLPRLAKMMDRCALVRSLTSLEGNHDRATHTMLTGWHPSPALAYPSMGSVTAKESGAASGLPHYICVPSAPDFAGAGYLTAAFEPFVAGLDRVRDLEPSVPAERLDRRRRMLADLERLSDRLETDAARDANVAQAWKLLATNEARAAFDLSREKPETRGRYGPKTLGGACLLARRLVEAGVRFVTVNDAGWDHHQNLFREMSATFPGKLPELDMAVSSLLTDLEERGLLQTTLVVVMGDFGRTPKLNSIGGRDHWPRASSVLFAGGGIKRGVVHGATDAWGELPAEDAVEPEDIVATMYRCLGIDAKKEYRTSTGRPVKVLAKGSPIDGIVA